MILIKKHKEVLVDPGTIIVVNRCRHYKKYIEESTSIKGSLDVERNRIYGIMPHSKYTSL